MIQRTTTPSYPGRAIARRSLNSRSSQHFANAYLGQLDRFVKEHLRIRGYVRYMDDMVIWGSSSAELQGVLQQCAAYLESQLGLSFKPSPYVNRVSHGMDFLGCRIYRCHMVPNHRSRVRFRKQLVQCEAQYEAGRMSERELQQRVTSLTAFLRTPGISSWQFRARLLEKSSVDGQ